MRPLLLLTALGLPLLTLGCDKAPAEDSADDAGGDGTTTPDGTDTGPTTETDDTGPAGPGPGPGTTDDTDTGGTAGPGPGTTDDTGTTHTGETGDTGGPAADLCDDGVEVLLFDETASWSDMGERVGDFTVETIDGPWTLSDQWTGCDVYIFLNLYNAGGNTYSDAWLDSSVREWLDSSPANVHYFFQSYESSTAAINDDVDAARTKVEDALGFMDKKDAAFWGDRIHYVTESARVIEGLGPILETYGLWHVGIDRGQTLREVGYLGDPATSWTTAPLAFTSYEVEHYNFEATRQAALDAEADVTSIRVFEEEYASDGGWTGARSSATVTFPDAATMATFDTMELDLLMDCGYPQTSACGEWDYLVYAYLCDADDPLTTDTDESTSCGTELGRFITAYARPGRWLLDVTPFLAMLQDGGDRTIQFWTVQGYDLTMDVRLSNQGKGYRPVAMEPLWSGGTLNADYNSNHTAITITPPADAARVDVMAVISGHGYSSDPEYCGEFCNHESHFTVNSAATYTKDHPEASTAYGCAETIADGTVPNQWGTWVYGRGGWCPGLQVDQWIADITADLTLGAENTLEHHVTINGVEPYATSTDGRIELTSYAVYYE